MSHFTTLKSKVKDLAALERAVIVMGLEWIPQSEARGYGSRLDGVKHTAVIKLKGPYDVAVDKKENGDVELMTDWWQGHTAQEVGENYHTLMSEYNQAVLAMKAEAEGVQWYRVSNAQEAQQFNDEHGLSEDDESYCQFKGQLVTMLGMNN